MVPDSGQKPTSQRAYKANCYLAEALKCFGFKADCVLYRKSNGEEVPASQFDTAMNELINRAYHRHLKKSQ